ncbi:hypothetical protein ERO13_D10G160266v2 [Gossypium hirsutum]|nr:hypothetical protein ERO13_D10G160266v2 [Gossypium hirsutum]
MEPRILHVTNSSHCFDNHGIKGSPTSTVIGTSKHQHSTLGDPNFVENYFKSGKYIFDESVSFILRYMLCFSTLYLIVSCIERHTMTITNLLRKM